MPFPTVTTVTDDFNRADQTPVTGGSWESVEWAGLTANRLAVVGNKLAAGPSGIFTSQHWDGSAGPDFESRATFTGDGFGEQFRFFGLLRDGGTSIVDGYALHVVVEFSLEMTIEAIEDGVLTQIGATAGGQLPASGDEFAFDGEVVDRGFGIGPEIWLRGWHKSPGAGWMQVVDGFDQRHLVAGTTALEIVGATTRLDDWRYGTKVPQPDTPIRDRPRPTTRRGAD